MARYTGSVCRLCRREGCKLFLKGDRCYSAKCAFTKRPAAPGQHGQSRKKLSEYGVQLRDKQKVKRAYGMQEGQFRSYFEDAVKMKGVSGANLLSLLLCASIQVVCRVRLGVHVQIIYPGKEEELELEAPGFWGSSQPEGGGLLRARVSFHSAARGAAAAPTLSLDRRFLNSKMGQCQFLPQGL